MDRFGEFFAEVKEEANRRIEDLIDPEGVYTAEDVPDLLGVVDDVWESGGTVEAAAELIVEMLQEALFEARS